MQVKINEKGGKRRLWIEGKLLMQAGFAIGDTYNAIMRADCVELLRSPRGTRRVYGRRGIQIIDITSSNLPRGTLTVERALDGIIVLRV